MQYYWPRASLFSCYYHLRVHPPASPLVAWTVSTSCLASVMRSATLTTTKFSSNAACRPCIAAALASLFIATFFLFSYQQLGLSVRSKEGRERGGDRWRKRVIKIGRVQRSALPCQRCKKLTINENLAFIGSRLFSRYKLGKNASELTFMIHSWAWVNVMR